MKQTAWPFVQLGDIAEFRNGMNYNKDNFGEGLKVVNVKDFQDRLIADLADLDEINPEGIVREECYLKDGDIIFVRSNGNRELIGRSMLVKGVTEPVSHSAFSIKVRFNANRVLPRFYAYVFRTALIRTELSNRGGGTNISNLNQDILSTLQVPKPPLTTQRKIASILSAYDDLIENNTRRIAILEAMAQAIYREWFVEFRFPGHEKVKLVDSPLGKIPEGWKVSPIQSYLNHSTSGLSPSNFAEEDFAHFSIPNFDKGKLPGIEKGASIQSNKFLVPEGCILLSKLNPRIPRIWLSDPDLAHRAIASTEFLVMTPKPSFSKEFIYCQLQSEEFYGRFNSCSSGTSTSHQRVKPTDFMKLQAVLPPNSLMSHFTDHATPLFRLIHNKKLQIQNLRKTRDLLLPKLISGQLDVEDLDIETGEAITE